jgi:hypothetical protein
MRDGAHVVEELGVNGPFLIAAEDLLADQPIARFGDGILEEELLVLKEAEAEPFMPDTPFVGRFSSIPPRWAPNAYQSCGCSLILLPG